MRRACIRLALLFTFILSAFISFSQVVKFNGRILNPKNESVAGAAVQVKGADIKAIADIEGRFQLQLEAGKNYTLIVSAVGFSTKEIEDVLAEAGSAEWTITLQSAPKEEKEIIIRSSAKKENTAGLLNFQRNNVSLSSGLSADFIRRTPDKNTGEILKRVSGASVQDNKYVVVRGLSDRYNTAIINGAQLPSTEPDKKVFSFDVFPATLIDNIIVNKTATPDLTGEFAGGLVQVNTKDVPTSDIFSFGLSYGFNTQSVFRDFTSNERNRYDWLGFDDGTRNLPAGFPKTAQEYRILGSNAAGVQQQLDLTRSFNSDVYARSTSTALPTQTYNLTWGKTNRFKNGGKLGTVVSLIYRNSMLKYSVDRAFNETNGNEVVRLNDQQNVFSVNWGAIANITYVKGNHKISFKNLFNQLFEDNFYTRSGASDDRLQEYDFSSSFLNQRSLYSSQLEGQHKIGSSGIKLVWNGNAGLNHKTQPDLRTQAYFKSLGSTTSPFEINDDDSRRFYSTLNDYSFGGNVSLEIPFRIAGKEQKFKAGGANLTRLRDFRSRIFRYIPTSLPQFITGNASLPFDKIYSSQNIGLNGFVMEEFTNNQDRYFGVSMVNAAFGMFDQQLSNKIRLVWGLRAENFQQFLTTKDNTNKRVVVQTEQWDLLPSFNLTISPTEKQNIRVAGSKTVSRPEFREIAPFAFFDYVMNYGVVGNPNLIRGEIWNADLRYEWYPKAGEGLSIGAFYKNFRNPIELRIDASSVVDRRIYNYSNTKEAYTVGGEIEVRKSLDFISSKLNRFGLFTNLTVSYSSVTLVSTTSGGASLSQVRPLQGQSPYLINAGLQYASEDGTWNASALYNRIGQRLYLVGDATLGIANTYERPRDMIDLQLTKRVMKKRGEIRLNVSDLLNPFYYFYDNLDEANAYKANTDKLFFAYRPGTTITLGFTYDLNKTTK